MPISSAFFSDWVIQTPQGLDLTGVTDNHTQVQAALNLVATTGGAVYLPPGIINIGTVGISVPSTTVSYKLFSFGSGGSGCKLKYTGSASAVTFGDNSNITYGASIEEIFIDLSGAAATAIGFNAIRTQRLLINRLDVESTKGSASLNGQIAIKLDGGTGTNFSAYTQIISPQIAGDFSTGILVTAVSAAANNRCQIIGGAIGGTTSPTVAAGIGLDIESSDTWRGSGTDITGWGTGFKLASNNNGPMDFSYELNTTDINVSGGGNVLFCDSLASKVTDSSPSTNAIWFSGLGGPTRLKAPVLATAVTTVGNLPTTPAKGDRAFVNDSNATSFTAGIGAVVAGGGTTNVPVVYDGTNWRIG